MHHVRPTHSPPLVIRRSQTTDSTSPSPFPASHQTPQRAPDRDDAIGARCGPVSWRSAFPGKIVPPGADRQRAHGKLRQTGPRDCSSDLRRRRRRGRAYSALRPPHPGLRHRGGRETGGVQARAPAAHRVVQTAWRHQRAGEQAPAGARGHGLGRQSRVGRGHRRGLGGCAGDRAHAGFRAAAEGGTDGRSRCETGSPRRDGRRARGRAGRGQRTGRPLCASLRRP